MLARRQQLILGQRTRSKNTDNSTFERPSTTPLFLGGGDVPGNMVLTPSVEYPTINSVANLGMSTSIGETKHTSC